MNPVLPSQSPDFNLIGSKIKEAIPEHKIHSMAKFKFKWKGHEYTITWENPEAKKNISQQDKTRFIDNQIDRILPLVERYLFQDDNTRSLRCSLDLKEVRQVDEGIGILKQIII